MLNTQKEIYKPVLQVKKFEDQKLPEPNRNYSPRPQTIQSQSQKFDFQQQNYSPYPIRQQPKSENPIKEKGFVPTSSIHAIPYYTTTGQCGSPRTQKPIFSQNSQQNNNHINLQQKEIQKPNQPTDPQKGNYDSFSGMSDSILDEGINVKQNIPQNREITASKQPLQQQQPQIQRPGMQPPEVFQIKNKDTGETYDIRDYNKASRMEGVIQQKNENKNWEDWWGQKKKANIELILMAKMNNYEKCVELLDKKKRGDLIADINAKNDDDWTALHFTSFNGNAKMVSFLLYHEAIIDCRTNKGQTPLMLASLKGFEDVFQILMTAGAEINAQDNNGDSSLHLASKNGNRKIVDMLLRKPSLEIKLKNKQNQEAFNLATHQEVIKSFQNFFAFQSSNQQSKPKLHIFNIKQEQVTQMFNDIGKNKLQEGDNFNQKNMQQNKSSIGSQGSENTTSHTDTSLDDEKIGPQSFIVHGLIGKGSFGEVYLVEKKNNHMLYAMKVLHKCKIMKQNLTRYAITERNVLSLTNHPFIVKMNYAFQTSDKLFLILDYCPGGDLGEHLQKEKKFTEERVRIYLAEIITALENLHKKDVIFRDLKPDNIVLDHQGHALLTDFGLSKEGVLEHSSGAKSFCGSVAYLAPEMLKRTGHGKAVDWYLLGVVMYELLVGVPPYYANNKEELFYNIEKAPLKLPSHLSAEAKSLLKALLQRNPAKRLGSGKGDSEEIKAHPFFSNINWDIVIQKKLNPPLPNRKIRISTKFDPNILENSQYIEPEKEHISGWSFVAPSMDN